MSTQFFNVQQGASEWLAMRNSRIGSSDAPVLMAGQTVTMSHIPKNVSFGEVEGDQVTLGDHPFRVIGSLWLEKCLGIAEEHSEYAQKMFEHGHGHEASVISEISDNLFKMLRPSVATKDDWMMASLDGISADRKIIGEAKAPVIQKRADGDVYSNALKLALEGKIPDYYWVQVQWSLAVTGAKVAYFGVRNPINNSLIGPFEVKPHKEFIDQMVTICKSYHDQFFNTTEEYDVLDQVASEYAAIQEQIKVLQATQAPLKTAMLAYAEKQPVNSVNFQRCSVTKNKGRKTIDYKSLVDSLSLDKEVLAAFSSQSEETSYTVRVRS